MSKAALGELLRASVNEFIKLIADVPTSERLHITRDFENRITILEEKKW